MKINWKIRFKQPVFVTSFFTLVITFIYNILGMFEVVPPVSQDMVVSVVIGVVQVLTALGVLVDPTTKGMSDSVTALAYTEPK